LALIYQFQELSSVFGTLSLLTVAAMLSNRLPDSSRILRHLFSFRFFSEKELPAPVAKRKRSHSRTAAYSTLGCI